MAALSKKEAVKLEKEKEKEKKEPGVVEGVMVMMNGGTTLLLLVWQ